MWIVAIVVVRESGANAPRWLGKQCDVFVVRQITRLHLQGNDTICLAFVLLLRG